jgi:hypothetical protein
MDRERYYERRDIDAWLVDLDLRIADGEAEAVEDALRFLEEDPYFFRSGYARERVARRLAHVELTPTQKARARAVVLTTVDGLRHCPLRGLSRLAGAVADNPLRRELRTRLHHPDAAVARRALRVVVTVRRPGLSPQDIGAARALVLDEAGRGQWLSPTVTRLAASLWSREWEAELRDLLPYHGPDRAGAKRLIEWTDRRRRRRDP